MKITILTMGARGDVQPLVALGKGLKSAGHDVIVTTHAVFEDLVRQSGLGFFPVRTDIKEALESEIGKAVRVINSYLSL